MPRQAIIVSPDQALVDALCRGLASSGVCERPTVVAYYPAISEIRDLIDSSGEVEVALVDLTGQSRALDLIRQLKDSHPNVLALAVDPAPSKTSFQGATEAGSWGYLAPPFHLGPLAEHFAQQVELAPAVGAAEAKESSSHPGRLISFIPVQGGNGASTTALHVATALAAAPDSRVLLIDFDFHSGTAAFRLRLKPKHTAADVLEWKSFSDDDWARATCQSRGLEILVAPSSSSSITGEMLGRMPDVIDSALRVYTHVVADLPDPLFTSSRQILTRSDRVYMVCTPELTSLHLARRKAQQLRDAGVATEHLGLIVNRVGSWGSFETQEVEKVVSVPVIQAFDNDYRGIREATVAGGLVSEESSLGRQFHELAAQIRTTLQPNLAPCP